jgi:hypothetical protein
MQRKVTRLHAVNVGRARCKRDALPTELTALAGVFATLPAFPNSFPNRSAKALYRVARSEATRLGRCDSARRSPN